MTRIISSPHFDMRAGVGRSRRIDTCRVSVPIPLRLPWSFESAPAHRRWRGRSAPPPDRPRDRHQPPAHVIVAHDGQQAAVQDGELLAQHSPDDEQRFNEDGQIGEALDQLL